MKPRGRSILALVVITATLLISTAVPASAATYSCERPAGTIQSRCWVGYQAYPYGQTTGLRSSMQGVADGLNYGITAQQQANTDEIIVKLRVWDLNEDGYRARVWAEVYQGCWCTYSSFRVESRTFDAFNNAGTDPPMLWYINTQTAAFDTSYTVRLRLGRYRGSDGAAQWGEEQVYHLSVN